MATETFAANTLIIPMDETFQNNGMWLAYGLVYRLLANGIPVKWAIKPNKAYGATDFTASTQDLQTLTAYPNQAYAGGPFIIDSAYYAQALPIVTAWQAANPTTKVHRATSGFSAPIASTLSRRPRIAVEETNSGIVIGYLNAAKIPDSNGNTWPNSSPDIIDPDEVGNGAFFGYNTTDPCRQLVYDIFLSPHTSDGTWTDATNAAELDLYVRIGGMIHAMCHSISAIENFAGPFLTTAGFTSFGNKGDPGTFTVDVPDFPTTQALPTSGKVQVLPGGSEQTWLHTSVTYLPSTQVLAHFMDNGTQYDFMVAGSYKGGTGAGKVEYEGGHQYSTSLPYSNNAEAPYLRFFYDAIFFAITKPRLEFVAIPKNIPSGVSTTVTFCLRNTGGSEAVGATASVTLAPFATYNPGSATITPTSIVGQTLTWNAAALAGNTGPGTVLCFTANVTPPGTGEQSAASYNTAYGDNFDESYNLSYCTSIKATPGAAPFVVKTPLNQTVNPSGPIGWTITAGNNGTLALNNVVITDTLPAGLTFSSAVPAPSSVVAGPGGTTIITWQAPQIPASIPPLTPLGISITLNATAPAATTASYTNNVTLTGNDTSPASYSVDAQATVNVVNRPPTVTVTAPNGGELVCNGINITWNASDPDGDPLTYTLYYSANGGTTFTQIVTGLMGVCPCSYFWNTSLLPSGNQYLVRVEASDGELTGSDQSDAVFTIDNTPPTVSWVSPASGSTLSTTPVELRATASDNVGVTSVLFQYSTDGITWTNIGSSAVPVGGFYTTNWEITGLPQGTYYLRAIATDQCGKTATTQSIPVTVNFPPEVNVVTPNGGEVLCPPSNNITWTASDANGAPLTYSLYYSSNGGATYTAIATGLTGVCTPAPCSYPWNTAALPSGSNYRIKVEASDGLTTTADVSDASFTIDNTPPNVLLTAPISGALLSSSPVQLRATATDNVGVAAVQFYYSTDGITWTLIGSTTTPVAGIYSFDWDISALPQGTYYLQARATDQCNNIGQSQSITVTKNFPPEATLQSPNGGEIICPPGTDITWTASDPDSGPLTYSLWYSSDGGVTYNVIATGLTGTCSPSPCTYPWNTTSLPSGSNYLIKVIASDGLESVEDVSNAPFTIDNSPPTLTFLTPPVEGAYVSGTVTLSVQATDNVGVTSVTFEYSANNGATYFPIATVISGVGGVYATSWNTVGLPDGTYKLRATAVDGCNNAAIQTRNVIVDNTPPAVQIPDPPNGSTVEGVVPILVTAQDNECLQKVDLYIDGQFIESVNVGGDTSTSFIYDWDTNLVSEGAHTVTAIATDCAGHTAETTNTYIVDNLPDHYTQVLVDGNLTIPPQKPDAEMVVDFTSEPVVDRTNIFPTLSGTKVTVRGHVDIGVTYSATDDAQTEHYAHFSVPFHAMVLFPDLPLNAEIETVVFVEHAQYHIIDPRTIKKDIVLFVGIREVT